MPSKRIDELTTRSVVNTDLLPPTPSGGPSGSATVAEVVKVGLSQPNSASSGAGASITIKAADGVTSGAGGNITITPGAQATTGGRGQVTIDGMIVGKGLANTATNTAVGVSALSSTTSGTNNIAIGNEAGKNITTGSNNITIGVSATGSSAILNSVHIGTNAGAGGKGQLQLCLGTQAGYNFNGDFNTAVGPYSFPSGLTGSSNSALGVSAGFFLTTGSNLVIIGTSAANTQADGATALTASQNSIYIGQGCRGFNNSDSNSLVIGYQAVGEGANTAVIGNSSTVQQHFYATRYIKTEGSLVFASSTPAAITSSQNNYVLTGSAFQRLNCTTASDITGIAPPTSGAHVDGRMIKVFNVGTANLTLKHNSTSSSAANRMYAASGSDIVLASNDYAECVYDSTDNGSGAAGWRAK